MKNKSFEEVNQIYDLEINKVIDTIKKQKAKKVLLQFPEGMKPYSQVICDEVEKRVKCDCFIFFDSCYGACDVPIEVERLGIDIVIQFGHSAWDHRKDLKVIK